MKHVSLFTGIGGFELAAERAGMENIAMCEFDGPASRVLTHHWPTVSLWGDVATLDGHELEADILTAGSPCQDFSIAGLRAGLAGERSGLFDHVIRLRDEIRPRFVVWENVPGALTSNKGADFANVIAALLGDDEPIFLPKHPNGRRSRYAGVAYGPAGTLAWRVLDAQHFGVPQRRQRIFAVLDTQGDASFHALFPGAKESGLHHGQVVIVPGRTKVVLLDVDGVPFDTGMAPPQPVKTKLAEVLEHEVDERYYLSEKACRGVLTRAGRRGRALPAVLDFALRLQAGEPVGPSPAYEPLCVTGDRTHALKAEGFDGSEDGTGRGQPIVPVASTLQGGGQRGYRIGAEDAAGGHLIPTLMKQREGKPGGGKGPLLFEDRSGTLATGNDQILFDPRVICGPEDRSSLAPRDTSPTLTAGQYKDPISLVEPTVHAVAEPAYGLHGTQEAIYLEGRALPLESNNGAYSSVVGHSITESPYYRVRRLTPTECERLQGFPDGHTAIPGAKDSNRYRQLGNAVAVPVAEWVLRRVAEAAKPRKRYIVRRIPRT